MLEAFLRVAIGAAVAVAALIVALSLLAELSVALP